MLAIGLLVVGILSRLFVHVSNFTPVIAIALFGGLYLKKKQALILPVALLALSDIFLGYHNTMIFTWGSVLLISLLGMGVRPRKNFFTVFGSSILASIVFYAIADLGVWLVGGLYPMTLSGLIECYAMGLPFFRTTLLSTVFYMFILSGVYELVSLRLKHTKFAHAL